jgi:hypothetical protein
MMTLPPDDDETEDGEHGADGTDGHASEGEAEAPGGSEDGADQPDDVHEEDEDEA